jgi:hypothetical protein
MEPGATLRGERNAVRYSSRVKSVSARDRKVELERPLPWAAARAWRPQLHRLRPRLSNVGIEAMTLEFKWSR